MEELYLEVADKLHMQLIWRNFSTQNTTSPVLASKICPNYFTFKMAINLAIFWAKCKMQIFLGAGLGDIAVPGLLACLALRFDSAKLLDDSSLRNSANAAASAFQNSLEASSVSPGRNLS